MPILNINAKSQQCGLNQLEVFKFISEYNVLPLTVMIFYIQLISTRCDGISMATSFKHPISHQSQNVLLVFQLRYSTSCIQIANGFKN